MEGPASDASGRLAPPPSALRVFCVCLGLGLRAFGGPAAHLGYFRQTFVSRLKWLEEGAFAQLVALCSVLPGLTSSQVSFAIGLSQAGFAGGLGAFSMYLGAASDTGLPGILAGLISVAGLFAPGFLLVAGVLPVWSRLSEQSWMPGFAAGAGAAVTGLLAAALWRPVITTAVVSPADAAIACAGFLALQLRAPVWLTLVLTALAGAGVSAAGL